jgi:ribosomal protein L11 methylase PrmA
VVLINETSLCRYYGYRLGEEMSVDPRLEVLDVEWFARKHVLDIGCNDGSLTLSMACKYGCKSAVGVDIDPHLISRACASLASAHTKCSRRIAQAQHRCGLVPSRFRHEDEKKKIMVISLRVNHW